MLWVKWGLNNFVIIWDYYFFKSWEFVCLHRSLSTLSQSHKFRSQCPTLTRSRSLGIFKGWSRSRDRSPNFLKPWSRSRSPTKNKDSASLPAYFNRFRVLASLLQRRRSPEILHYVWPSPGLVHYIYILGGCCLLRNFARCNIDFTSKYYALLYWQHYCTALK